MRELLGLGDCFMGKNNVCRHLMPKEIQYSALLSCFVATGKLLFFFSEVPDT